MKHFKVYYTNALVVSEVSWSEAIFFGDEKDLNRFCKQWRWTQCQPLLDWELKLAYRKGAKIYTSDRLYSLDYKEFPKE